MPFKANAERRQHISKQRHRVTNSAAYDAALRQRGSLTVWFTDAAIAAWKAEPRTTRGGQSRYSALAIATALTLRSVFRLALRQTEGLIGSIIALLGLDLAVPDHTTLSRRAEGLDVVRPQPGSGPVHLLVDSTGLKLCGSGEWLLEKHEDEDPAVMAQVAHRVGRRHRADRGRDGHHQRRRRCLASWVLSQSSRWPSRVVHCRRCLRSRRRLQ